MWFWIGLALLLLWGGWGYLRRRWASRRAEPPPLTMPERIVTAVAGAAAIIGLFLVIGSRWGWFV